MWVAKKYCWVWIAVDRHGKRVLDFVCGRRDTLTFWKIWDRLCEMEVGGGGCSDRWRSYAQTIPMRKHNATKKITFTVEGYNGRIRHFLARFKRKTKCYSKSQYMMDISLKLLFLLHLFNNTQNK